MPIYKGNGKKDGLYRYNVRINYVSDSGEAKQLTRIAYGLDNARILENKLNNSLKVKGERPIKKITLQELFDEFISVKKMELKEISIYTMSSVYDNHLKPTLKDYRLDRITVRVIQEWKLRQSEKQLSLSINQSAFKLLGSLIKFANQMEYLNKNPFDKIGNFKDKSTIKKEMDYYTFEEFKVFITKAREIAEKTELNLKSLFEWDFYVFFNIAFYTGLRKGEIAALKWSDLEENYVSVKRTLTQRIKGRALETTPKTKSSIRTIQIPIPLISVLEEHKKRQQTLHNFTDDFRICNLRTGTLSSRNKLYSLKAGLKTIRIHDFRHSHVSLLANENINIQEIARRLGHKKIEMTWNTYCHLYPGEEERAVTVLNQFI